MWEVEQRLDREPFLSCKQTHYRWWLLTYLLTCYDCVQERHSGSVPTGKRSGRKEDTAQEEPEYKKAKEEESKHPGTMQW